MVDFTVSIIMPALNEEKNIVNAVHTALQVIKEMNIIGEVVVIDDGSTDKTKALVEDIAKNHANVHVIHHDTPRGVGYSFWDGAAHASMELVTMSPGDNENDPRETLQFLNLMNNVDIVVPFIYNLEVRSRLRRILSSAYRMIMNMTFGTNLNYTNGAVLYRKCIFDGFVLKSQGFFYQAELLIKLIRQGYLFAEVPHFLSVRGGGKSKAVTFPSLLKVIREYTRLCYDIHIKRISGAIGKTLHTDSVTFKKITRQGN